jgi:hypothetical protein
MTTFKTKPIFADSQGPPRATEGARRGFWRRRRRQLWGRRSTEVSRLLYLSFEALINHFLDNKKVRNACSFF